MSIELLKSISTQKAHKTCYKQGSILHYLGTNHPCSSGCEDHGPHNAPLFRGWNFVLFSVGENTVF